MDAPTQWVRELATAIPRGGEQADLAIRTLGLLIEREKASHPAGDDGGVTELLGPELAAHRLTPAAIHEAVNLLLAHLTEVRVPEPGIVWALTKSFDPRIVPHLAALLERVIDDPVHEAVASQVVDSLTCFFDARSIAAVRLAAERGHGDAREHAAYWLRLRDTESILADPAKTHAPSSSCPLNANAYHLQRRPGSAQLIVNDGPGGLIVLDAVSGSEVARAAFSPGFPRDQLVRAWCLSADGSQVAVFADGGAGSLVSLASGASEDFAAPLNGDMEDLRYLWDDRLIVAVGEVATLFGLSRTEEGVRFDRLRSLEVRRDHRSWMRCVDTLMPMTSRLLRTEPHEHRMVAYDFARPPGELVVLGPAGNPELCVSASQFVPAAAFSPGRLFLLYDHEVQAIDEHGVTTDVFPAPEHTYLRALDIVGDSLVVAATRLDDSTRSMLLRYSV